MKFDENINELLNKYPLNEDLGNIFGTLGRLVKNKIDYITEPLTKPFKDASTDYNDSKKKFKGDTSKGDDIIIKSTDDFLKDSNIANKKINFTQNGKPLLPNGSASYNELQKTKLTGTDPNTNQPVDYNKELRKIIYVLDLNKLNLIQGNEKLIKQQLQKELKTRKDKTKLKIDEVYNRFVELLQKTIFIPKPKDLELKIKWLYILAKPNQVIQAPTQNTKKANKSKPQQQNPNKPPQTNPPTPATTPTPTPTRTPRTRTPAPPTRVVRPRTP
jgi:hypothetical protein